MSKFKKTETSKVIAYISSLSSFILSIFVVYCTIKGIECSSLATITGVAWGETAASNASYYMKTKKENVPKIIMNIYKELPEELKTQVDINTLMSSLMN